MLAVNNDSVPRALPHLVRLAVGRIGIEVAVAIFFGDVELVDCWAITNITTSQFRPD